MLKYIWKEEKFLSLITLINLGFGIFQITDGDAFMAGITLFVTGFLLAALFSLAFMHEMTEDLKKITKDYEKNRLTDTWGRM